MKASEPYVPSQVVTYTEQNDKFGNADTVNNFVWGQQGHAPHLKKWLQPNPNDKLENKYTQSPAGFT